MLTDPDTVHIILTLETEKETEVNIQMRMADWFTMAVVISKVTQADDKTRWPQLDNTVITNNIVITNNKSGQKL